jgi:hypothetical protein
MKKVQKCRDSMRPSNFLSPSSWKKRSATCPLLLAVAISSILADDAGIDLSMLPELMEGGAPGSPSPRCVSDGLIGIVRGKSASTTNHVQSVLRSHFISLRTEIIAAPSDILDWEMFGKARTPGRGMLDHVTCGAPGKVRDQLARSSVVVMLDASALPYVPALRPGVESMLDGHDELLVSQNALPQELVLIESGWQIKAGSPEAEVYQRSEHSFYKALGTGRGMHRSLETVVSAALTKVMGWRRKFLGAEGCTADDLLTLPRYRLMHLGHTVRSPSACQSCNRSLCTTRRAYH